MTTNIWQAAPTRRLKPTDGMAVTAEVWDEAHDYHRVQHQWHLRWQHGAGIVAGLEVIANDPPDNAVYILPGLAVDAVGQIIVIPEPLSFDMGHASEGVLHLLLSYGEGRPRPKDGRQEEGSAFYVQGEFGLEATPQLPTTPYVELARVRRDRMVPLTTARQPAQPGLNEIDLRYRQMIGAAPMTPFTIGVLALNGQPSPLGAGAARLAQALRHEPGLPPVWADGLGWQADFAAYPLLYAIGQGAFALAPDQMTALYNYLKQGGTLLFEADPRDEKAAQQAQHTFGEMLESFGQAVTPLPAAHPLRDEPYFFPTLPAGYDLQAGPELKAGEGVIISTGGYGAVWNGERRGRAATRDEVRGAYEWGRNLVQYAARRAKMWDDDSQIVLSRRA